MVSQRRVAVVSGSALNGFPPSKPVPQHHVSRWFGAHMGSPQIVNTGTLREPGRGVNLDDKKSCRIFSRSRFTVKSLIIFVLIGLN